MDKPDTAAPAQAFGLSAALATPFRHDGEVESACCIEHACRCLEQGCDSITALGTTGENASLDMRARETVLKALSAADITGRRLVVGICASDADTAAAQIAQATEFGAGHILLPPPFYFKGVSQQGLFDWYAQLLHSGGASTPATLLYHIPSQTGLDISVELISRLRAEFGQTIAGVKDSGGQWDYTEKLLDAHADLAILIGDERHLGAALRNGAQGSICGVSNLHPQRMRAIIDSAEQDPGITALVELLLRYPIVPALKTLMAYTLDAPQWLRLRAPLCTLSADQQRELISAYRQLALQPDR